MNLLILILILILIIILILITCIIKNKYETLEPISKLIGYSDINKLNKNETIIIIGKGPNLDYFIDNISSFDKFKKIGLNSVILTDKIKFDFFMMQDFTKKVPIDYVRSIVGKLDKIENHYSKHINLAIQKDTNIYDQQSIFNCAIKNNIKIFINDIRDDNNKKLHYNNIPYQIENHPKTEITKMILSYNKKNQIGDKENNFIVSRVSPPTVAVNCILKMISLGYKNILLTGITMMNNYNVKKEYIKFLNSLKEKYPNVKFYILYPCKLSNDVFDFYLN